jgi:hypothetical protein
MAGVLIQRNPKPQAHGHIRDAGTDPGVKRSISNRFGVGNRNIHQSASLISPGFYDDNFHIENIHGIRLNMEFVNIFDPVLSGIITGIVLLIVSQKITKIRETERCRSLIAFLRLEIINNYRLLGEFEPGGKQPPVLEDDVWEKVNTEIINKLPFVLTNHLIMHYYFIRNSSKQLPASTLPELERQKNRMRFLIRRLQKFQNKDRFMPIHDLK